MALLHSPLVFLLLHVLFISVVPQILKSSPRTEAEALVKWKSSLLPSASLSSWPSSNLENLCNWTGITCNSAGTVSNLNFSGQKHNGTLSYFSFSSFRNLTSLDMSHNLLSDFIPGGIGDLAELQYLSFYENDINDLRNLAFLDLSRNELTGSLPKNISKLFKLEELRLGKNNFTGPIPSSISQLRQLQTPDLKEIYLNSSIPPELGLCTKLTFLALALTELYIKNNTFTGIIPPEIGTLTNLTYIGNLKELLELDLSESYLEGSIPAKIGKLTKLVVLHLHFNNLSGTVPPEIGNLAQLEILDLQNSQFDGVVPDSIAELSHLNLIHLHNNRFSGSLPKDLGKKNLHLSTGFYRHAWETAPN
nr:PREDICTED: probable leucine-rich repeat receptor-like protein kinase At1g35710 [Daucus carota subsp. sativus]